MTLVTHVWFPIYKLLNGSSLIHFSLSSSACLETLTDVLQSASKLGKG